MNDLILGHGKIRLGIVVHVRIPSIDLRNQPNFGQSNSNLLLDSFEPMLGSDKDLELFIGEIKKSSFRLTINFHEDLLGLISTSLYHLTHSSSAHNSHGFWCLKIYEVFYICSLRNLWVSKESFGNYHTMWKLSFLSQN